MKNRSSELKSHTDRSYILLLLEDKNLICLFFVVAGCFLSHTEAAKSSSTQQFFSVKPHDTEVRQGGTVVLPCEIGDRRGRVQWTKDGLTLGKPSFFFL
jgi:hypothetical protein